MDTSRKELIYCADVSGISFECADIEDACRQMYEEHRAIYIKDETPVSYDIYAEDIEDILLDRLYQELGECCEDYEFTAEQTDIINKHLDNMIHELGKAPFWKVRRMSTSEEAEFNLYYQTYVSHREAEKALKTDK